MCLRQRQPPKPKEDTRQSNAEKCRQYKENLKKDSEKWKAYLYKNKVQAQQWRGNQTEEQKEHTRELARKRQQKRREKLAQSEATPKKTSTPKKSPTPNRVTRLTQTKLKEKREKDRIRQAKHRAAVKANPQKFRREKEKRKNKRLEKKAVEEEQKRGKVKVPTTVKLSFKKCSKSAPLVIQTGSLCTRAYKVHRCPKQSCHHIVTDYKVFLTDDLKHDAHVDMLLVLAGKVEAFANVLGVKIVSIYPTKGPSVMRKTFRLPCHAKEKTGGSILMMYRFFGPQTGSDMNE
ncbi:hypothetical protein RRG08_035829 [Elysia crispata]|uniref:Uncharacterized protein n=1 Tax=Elysia crispata TaxID=231223 RepID=A0AAE0YTP4_9GAST|nr:hypothetical protein RRG08_035829 [Elysia crispata]